MANDVSEIIFAKKGEEWEKVTHCNDCRYYKIFADGGWCRKYTHEAKAEGYCSDAERKEN